MCHLSFCQENSRVKLFHMAEPSTCRTRPGVGTACDKEKSPWHSSCLREAEVCTKTSSPLDAAARGRCTPGAHLGDEVWVLLTGELQDWLLEALYVQRCLGSRLLLNEVQEVLHLLPGKVQHWVEIVHHTIWKGEDRETGRMWQRRLQRHSYRDQQRGERLWVAQLALYLS